jgi:hypothetical protein
MDVVGFRKGTEISGVLHRVDFRKRIEMYGYGRF